MVIKRWLNAIDDVTATIALAGVIVMTVINVIFRYVFSSPIAWTMEIALALFLWFVFIGISSTMKRDGHIGVDFFVKNLPRPFRIVTEIIRIAAIYYVLLYVFVYLGASFTLDVTGKLTPILGISYQVIDIAVPIGGALTAIHFTRTVIRSFQAEFLKEGGS